MPAEPPAWPPDAFAVCASLLHRSGAYVNVLEQWPPSTPPRRRGRRSAPWVDEIVQTGRSWRKVRSPPSSVLASWQAIFAARSEAVVQIGVLAAVWQALVEVAAAADEACEGAGRPAPKGRMRDELADELVLQLLTTQKSGTTLCRGVDESLVRVLPKSHTPQCGATLRSLTHHLALIHHSDVIPFWHSVPSAVPRHGLNLLLMPFPMDVRPSSFSPAPAPPGNMDETRFGLFEYRAGGGGPAAGEAQRCIERAREMVGQVDGLVFPELALDERGRSDVEHLARKEGVFVIAGVGRRPVDGTSLGENLVYFYATTPQARDVAVAFEQHKHHRWRLDRGQIVQYGLGGRLDPARSWWEATRLGRRELKFVTIHDWFTLCTLVCEDLARQDPVAQLVRSVGPNLVVALLMDGPQTAARWSARYATVLADDPGCSVLTLTCAGMMELARPVAGVARSRAVALWKDPSGGTTEIELPVGSRAVLLSLARERDEEWTSDGRRHITEGGRLVLVGVHAVTP